MVTRSLEVTLEVCWSKCLTIQRFRCYYGPCFSSGISQKAVGASLKRYKSCCYGISPGPEARALVSRRVPGWCGMAGKDKVRIPNPAKVPKGRLDAPAARPHRSRKRYRRRPKHPGAESV